MRSCQPFRLLSVVIGVSLVATTSVQADPPSTYFATYYVHQTPGDSSTPLLYTLTFTLRPARVVGEYVGWQVYETTLARPDANGGAPLVFADVAPSVDSSDGLWWVPHGDPDAPRIEEFELSPPLSGTALASDPAHPDLEYTFEGHGGFTDGGGSNTDYAIASYTLTQSGEVDPDEEGDDTPVPTTPDYPPAL